jgi:hypothetical protein
MTLTQNSPQNLEVLRSVFSQAAGQTTQVRLTEIEDDEVAPAGAGDEARPPSEGELLDRIKETFDAREVEETE